uniref:(northern house mosquito) hypothetical protein n=1 Tax=Culex pipiens TaxID=7175 RepID=A0A8D8K9T5_CULPI
MHGYCTERDHLFPPSNPFLVVSRKGMIVRGGRGSVLIQRRRGKILLHRVVVVVRRADLVMMVMMVRAEASLRRNDVPRRRWRRSGSFRQQPVVLLEDQMGSGVDQQAVLLAGQQPVVIGQRVPVGVLNLRGQEGGMAHVVGRVADDHVASAVGA